MNATAVLDISMQAMLASAKLAAPILITALVIGFAVSLVQSITQIQEPTLSFVPKAVGVALALLICGQWMISVMLTFTTDMFQRIPALLGGG